MKQYFGIDIGGTAVKLGIVDETGRVLLKGEESVSFDGYQTVRGTKGCPGEKQSKLKGERVMWKL